MSLDMKIDAEKESYLLYPTPIGKFYFLDLLLEKQNTWAKRAKINAYFINHSKTEAHLKIINMDMDMKDLFLFM